MCVDAEVLLTCARRRSGRKSRQEYIGVAFRKRHGDVWTRASKGVRSQDDGKRESKEEGRERESATCTMARSGENGME